MQDDYTHVQENTAIIVGVLLSFFVGFIFGGAVFMITGSWPLSLFVWFTGFVTSLDICFWGRNG